LIGKNKLGKQCGHFDENQNNQMKTSLVVPK